MSDLQNLLEMDWHNGLLFIAAIIIVFVWIIQKFEYICQKFGIKTKSMLRMEKHASDIQELKDHAKKTDTNMDKLFQCIDELKDSVMGISKQVEDLQRKNDMNEAARLKDRIAQAYRYWSERGEWTSRDKESLTDMIEAYSQYSQNSFVHSVVEKEMHTWKVIDD